MGLKVADRISHVDEYYFSRKLREIAGLKAAGRPIINLGIGSPDLPPHPLVIDSLNRNSLDPKLHGYQSYQGLPALRDAWSAFYQNKYRVAVDPNREVLPLIGSKEGIMHICMAFVDPGDQVLIPDPGYPTYASASRIAGAQIVPYSLKEENNWYPDWDQINSLDLKSVKLMWVNYPHMPTGAPADESLFEKLTKWAEQHQILVIHDNPYGFIRTGNATSIFNKKVHSPYVLELNSLSKSHNLAGWRHGVLIGSQHLVKSVLTFKSNMDSGMFAPSQYAAIQALSLPNDWYEELNRVYHRRALLAREIMDILRCTCRSDQVGMFIWGKVPELDGYAISDRLLYDQDVFITPGGIFGKEGENYIRISLCANEDMLNQVVDRLSKKVTI